MNEVIGRITGKAKKFDDGKTYWLVDSAASQEDFLVLKERWQAKGYAVRVYVHPIDLKTTTRTFEPITFVWDVYIRDQPYVLPTKQ
jgi:hypothetical protein